MTRLLRFDGVVPHDPGIAAWFEARRTELGAIAERWWAPIRACGDDVREVLHDGMPTACVEDAGFAYVNAFTAHVNVGFFYGAGLDDPAGLLEGTGKNGRHVKLRPGRAVDEAALAALIDAAYRDIVFRLAHDE
jgi:hypothetical protein